LSFWIFRFSSLSRRQFEHLKAAYGGGRSRLIYSPSRTYSLSDFLPPFAKATLNTNFLPELVISSGSARVLTSNCWGTVYEFSRGADDAFSVFMSPSWANEVEEFVTNGAGNYPEVSGDIDPNTFTGHFGDILLIYKGQTLAHAAVYIDRGLWFEKTGTTSNMAYRLTTKVVEPYQEAEYRSTIIRLGHPTGLRSPHVFLRSTKYSCHDKQLVESKFEDRKYRIRFDRTGLPRLSIIALRRGCGVPLDPWFQYYSKVDPKQNPFDLVCVDPQGPKSGKISPPTIDR
jgi:hypothetical protein